MAGLISLSEDVEGMAPSHPDDPSTQPPIPKVKGRVPSAEPPVETETAPPQAAPAQAPATPEDASAPPPDDSDNPFVDKTANATPPAAPDDSDNPFVDKTPPTPDTSAMKSYISTNLQAHAAAQTLTPNAEQMGVQPLEIKPEDPIHDFIHGLGAGLQMSVSGLGIRGKMPDTILPGQADMAMRIGNQIGQLTGDLPAMIGGMVAGGAAGGTAGTAVLPVLGTVSGAAVGSMAGAFAVPAAIRKMLIDHYEKGDITDSREFSARLMATSWEALKGGITGAATALTGGAAAPVMGAAAGAGAELVAMTTVGSALEGHLPHAQDFIDGAIVIGGLHAAGHLVGQAPTDAKLRNIFSQTGETPQQIVEAAQRDVELKQNLIAGNAQEPVQATPTSLTHDVAKEAPTTENGAETLAATPTGDEKVVGTKTDLVPKTAEEMGIETPIEPSTPGDLDKLSDEYTARSDILEKIGISADPTKKTFGEKWDDFYARNVDFLDPLNVAIKSAIAKGADIATSAYDLGRLAAAHMDKTRSFLEFGTRDAETGEINGEGLNKIYKGTPDGDLDGLRAYAMAKQAIDLSNRGIQPWANFDKVGAQRLVDATAGKFEATNQRRIAFSNRVLEYARDKGLFSQDQINAMNEANPNYSPSNRVMEADDFTGKVPGGSAVKKIYGSEKNIVDPILQTYKNTEAIIKRSLVNETRSTFVDNMKEGGLLGTGEEGEDVSDKYLVKVDSRKLIFSEGGTVVGTTSKPLADNQIALYRDGVREVYEGSPGVIDSLKRLDGDTTAMDLTTKVLRGFSNAVRLGVVSNPAFGLAHFFRSQIMSSVYSKTGMLPFQSLLSLGDFMNKSDMYQQWVYDGGATGSLFKMNETYLEGNKVFDANKDAPFIGKAWNSIKKPFEASEAFIKLTDNLSRFTEYKRSIAEGVGRTEAAMRSRDVVPDYAKCGLQRSVLRTGVAFIGAHINSLDRMAEAFQEDPTGTTMKMGVITAMSAALWYVNKDDDAIQTLPDWQKNTYWNINVSRFSPNYKPGTEATVLRLPKPWAPGIMFGSGAEVALDSFFKDNPKEFGHFATTMAKSVFPELIPNMAQPIMDQYSNKQAFTGRPLVPQYQQELLPEMQYSPYTSETAKQIAKLIGYVPLVKDLGPSTDPLASPAVVENYIKSWGGTMGGWALKLSDNLQRAGSAAASGAGVAGTANSFWNSSKAEPWQDTAVLHQFVSRYPSFSNQGVQDFYENRDEADKAFNSYKGLAKTGDMDAAEKMAIAHPEMQMRLDDISKAISAARKTFSNIQENPDIPAVEKRQNLDTILFQIGSMAKEGNQMMNDFKKNTVQNGLAGGK